MSRRIEVRIARTETGEPLCFPIKLKDGKVLEKWMYEIVDFESISDEDRELLIAANNGYDSKGLLGLLDCLFIDPSNPEATGYLVYGVNREGKGYIKPDDSAVRALSAYERYLARK